MSVHERKLKNVTTACSDDDDAVNDPVMVDNLPTSHNTRIRHASLNPSTTVHLMADKSHSQPVWIPFFFTFMWSIQSRWTWKRQEKQSSRHTPARVCASRPRARKQKLLMVFFLIMEHSLSTQAAQLVFLWRRFLSLWLLVEFVFLRWRPNNKHPRFTALSLGRKFHPCIFFKAAHLKRSTLAEQRCQQQKRDNG